MFLKTFQKMEVKKRIRILNQIQESTSSDHYNEEGSRVGIFNFDMSGD